MRKQYINSLKEIISNYQYGKFDLLERDFKIEFSSKTNDIFISDFDSFLKDDKYGICHELAMRSYQKIRTELPYIKVYRTDGFDNNFFKPRDKYEAKFINHVFLVCIERNKIEKVKEENFSNIFLKYAVIVDPSSGIISKYTKSGYTTKRVIHENEKLRFDLDLKIKKGNVRPLGIRKNTLVEMCFNDEFPSFLGYRFSMIEDDKRNYYYVDSKNEELLKSLDKINNNEEDKLVQLMIKLSNMKIDISSKYFKVKKIDIN